MFKIDDDENLPDGDTVKIIANLDFRGKIYPYGFFWPKIYKNHTSFLINKRNLLAPNFERIFDQLSNMNMTAVSLSKKALEDTKLKVGDHLKYERIDGDIIFTKV